MVANAAGGGDLAARLRWLQPEPAEDGWEDADLRTMAALGFKPPVKD